MKRQLKNTINVATLLSLSFLVGTELSASQDKYPTRYLSGKVNIGVEDRNLVSGYALRHVSRSVLDSALSGDSDTMLKIGETALSNGPKGSTAPLFWIELSSKYGNPRADFTLYKFYRTTEGDGHGRALIFLELSAREGAPGKFFDELEKMSPHLFESCRKLADEGDPDAQYVVGRVLLEGKHVKMNAPSAAEYLMISAKNGNADAQAMIGYMFHEGHILQKNLGEAFAYNLEAAKQGQRVGQFNLADQYLNGNGVAKNLEKSIYWFKASANQGYKEASKVLQRYEEYRRRPTLVKCHRCNGSGSIGTGTSYVTCPGCNGERYR